jgi:hypothetical protein
VNQTSGTVTTDAPAQAQDQSPPAPPAGAAIAAEPSGSQPGDSAGAQPGGFQSRGRARRRARFLRKARELAYRDLGGLVFNLHRFGARNDALVLAKLTTLTQIDTELRAIESALGERRPITVLREAGITACPRCAAIHGSEDSFCPNCGLSMGRHADLPIGGAAAAPAPAAQPAASAPAPAPSPQTTVSAPAPAPSPQAAPAPAPTPAPQAAPASTPAQAAPAPSTTAPAPAPSTAEPVPAAPAPAPSAGRSPTPPATFGATPAEEDGPTEILRPPVSGS